MPPISDAPGRVSPLWGWAQEHIDQALLILYGAAALLFAAAIWILRRPSMLLGVIVGFGVARAVFLVAERLAEAVFIENVASGHFLEALRAPGLAKGRQVGVLQRLVSDRLNRRLAENAASYVSYCIDSDREDMAPVARRFEDVWGVPPGPGEDDSLVRRLLRGGIKFTTLVAPPPDKVGISDHGIPWKTLWRRRLWSQLRELHPGEPLGRLLLRLYAAEWQSLLAPIWVLAAIATTIVVSKPYLAPLPRAITFYTMGTLLATTAIWLAFILRPTAFNASLLASDMDRCARWVLESTEGKHFLVSALGSARSELRYQATRLLIWHDALHEADVTLPEGMKAFCRREGS